jgi:serine/threonine-protein kinase
VKDEAHWAIEERPGRIIPVLMEDCDVRDLHIRLPRIQYVDFRTVDEEARRRLLACWGIEYCPAARFQVRFHSLGGRYSIGEPLGARDSLAEYLGRDTALDRSVLIKCDRSDRTYAELAHGLNRVATEARATASFIHPGIPRVFDLAHDPDVGTYSVLEHVPGTLLRDYVKTNGPLTTADAVDLMTSLCDAVNYANNHGVIHRNIKPSSIVIADDGRPFLTNFIIAKIGGHREEQGAMIGTLTYMAPEQCTGQAEIDCRVDVWGLGVLLYELLTGKLPFHRGAISQGFPDILFSIISDPPRALRELNPKTPKALETVCLKCLEKKPGDRFSTASELGAALAACRPRKGRIWPW